MSAEVRGLNALTRASKVGGDSLVPSWMPQSLKTRLYIFLGLTVVTGVVLWNVTKE